MMRYVTITILLLGAAIAVALWWSAPQPIDKSSASIPQPSIAIADTSEALSFARYQGRTFAVTGYQDGVVRGVEIGEAGEDAISLVNRLGYDAAKAMIDVMIEGGSDAIELDAASLSVPVDLMDRHIAVGTNYAEHAEEASVEDGPFLFPKYVTPTGARAPIPLGDGLLDYEVELCLVTTAPTAVAEAAQGGLILCNDVTDRALLLRTLNTDDPTSGEGFTDGKSAPGFLPVGDLYIVPRDLNAFVEGLTLQLSVNGIERQRSAVTQWIWDFDRTLSETGQASGRSWNWREGTARLPVTEDGIIPARTLVLAGTPSGTIFSGVYSRAYVMGFWHLLAGGWDQSISDHVIEAQIAQATAMQEYLEHGDQITIRVGKMGTLHNSVQ